MLDDNKLCGRKLVFGDLKQIEALKEIENEIEDFLKLKDQICHDGDWKDCIECFGMPFECAGCDEFEQVMDSVEYRMNMTCHPSTHRK